MKEDETMCPVGGKCLKMSHSSGKSPGFEPVSGPDRELREDHAFLLRERGETYDDIAERLGFDCKGCAHRAVERGMWRRAPDQATAKLLMEIDAKTMRLWPRVRRRDPDAIREMRDMMQQRLELTAPHLAAVPLPAPNPKLHERDRQLRLTLRAIARADAKLVASIPTPSPEEIAQAAAELGFSIGRNGLPGPPRRRPGRPPRSS